MRLSINTNHTKRIVEALERAGYQATPNRRLVAELVASTSGHFTAADLLEIEGAAVKIQVQGDRYPEALEKRTGI